MDPIDPARYVRGKAGNLVPVHFLSVRDIFLHMRTSLPSIVIWAFVVLYASLIFTWSSYSKPPLVPKWDIPNIDKLYHACEYAGLAWLLIRALQRTFPARPARQLILWGVLLTVGYGLTDELHQAFVPERTMSLYDALADAVGASMAGWVWEKISHHWWRLIDSGGRS